jgi:hypothetical protein
MILAPSEILSAPFPPFACAPAAETDAQRGFAQSFAKLGEAWRDLARLGEVH